MKALGAALIGVGCTMLLISPAPAEQAVYKRLCASTLCTGSFARIELFNDAQGRLARIRFIGDFRVCSHPPVIYFDRDGMSLATFDNRPLADKTMHDEATRAHAKMTEGLVAGGQASCMTICNAKPERPDLSDCRP